MMKMDLGTGSGSKIFQLNDEDIELIVRLLHVECDHHVYHIELDVDQGYFKDRYDYIAKEAGNGSRN